MAIEDLRRGVVAVVEAVQKGTLWWRAGVTIAIVAFALWSAGKLPLVPWHSDGFAFADDASAARDKIRTDVSRISGEVSGLKGALADLSKAVSEADQKRAAEARDNATRQVRRQIYETERDACNAKSVEMRNLLLSQAQDLRGDFRNLTGSEYPAFAGCSAYH